MQDPVILKVLEGDSENHSKSNFESHSESYSENHLNIIQKVIQS